MNDLGLDEVHTTFLDQWLASFAMLQEVLPHEVCFNVVFAQVTDTLGLVLSRLPHGTHIVSEDIQFSTRIVFFCNLGVFYHPRHGVGLNRLVAQERILQTTWVRR